MTTIQDSIVMLCREIKKARWMPSKMSGSGDEQNRLRSTSCDTTNLLDGQKTHHFVMAYILQLTTWTTAISIGSVSGGISFSTG